MKQVFLSLLEFLLSANALTSLETLIYDGIWKKKM